jgi:hypothetical protein
MHLKILKVLKISLILLFISTHLSAHIFIDVSEFSFASQGKRGLRICVFDTDKQKYEYIDYYPYPSSTKGRLSRKQLNYEYHGFKIFYDGTVKTPKEFDGKKYIVRTFKSFRNPAHDSKKLLMYKDNTFETGDSIQLKLNKVNYGGVKSVMQVNFVGQDGGLYIATLKGISANKNENDSERGVIGELATEFTMISFGYDKLSSQNNSNQGFDGVFTDQSVNPELFLTESKCWEVSMTAQKILQKYLSVQEVHRKTLQLKRIKELTYHTINDFIVNKPECIYLFSHRVKADGACQCYVEKFSVGGYFNSLIHQLNFDSPPEEKQTLFRRLRDQLFRNNNEFLEFCNSL